MRSLILAISIALLPGTGIAEALHWAAASKNAVAVTGDIAVDNDTLIFAGGQSLKLKPYEMARNGDWPESGDEIAGDVFKIEPPSSPKLRHGKPLCEELATYVVLWTYGEGEMTLNFYSGAAAPIGNPDADALCAAYSYELR
jgi:hypothetical protein